MCLRAWIVAIAIGLAAPALGQGYNQRTNSEDRTQNTAPDDSAAPLSVPVQIVEADADKDAR